VCPPSRKIFKLGLHIEMERIGSVQLRRTLSELAKGLPVYDVIFHENRVEVRSGGVVG
jgi:hypothetical protein